MTQNDPNWNYLRDKFPQNDPFTNMTMANNLVYAQKRIVKKKNSWKWFLDPLGPKTGPTVHATGRAVYKKQKIAKYYEPYILIGPKEVNN